MGFLLPRISELTNFILHEHEKCDQSLFSLTFPCVIHKSFGMCSKNAALVISDGVTIVMDSWADSSLREHWKCFLRI